MADSSFPNPHFVCKLECIHWWHTFSVTVLKVKVQFIHFWEQKFVKCSSLNSKSLAVVFAVLLVCFKFICFKTRVTERWNNLLSTGSTPTWPQQLELDQAKAQAWNSIQVTPVSGRSPTMWSILHCFPRDISGQLVWSRVARMWTAFIGMPASQAGTKPLDHNVGPWQFLQIKMLLGKSSLFSWQLELFKCSSWKKSPPF